MGKNLLGCTLVGGLLLLAGCGPLIEFFLPPPPPKTVEAEFAGLAKHRVAIVIQMDPTVEYEYPHGCRIGLPARRTTPGEHRGHHGGRAPRRAALSAAGPGLGGDGATKLGTKFGANYVLLLAVSKYSMREPGSVGLYRGRIVAEVSLYDASLPERQATVWRGSNLWAAFPPANQPGQPAESDRQVRRRIVSMFAD